MNGAIRHRTPHPEDRNKCGGCRLVADVMRLRRIEAAARDWAAVPSSRATLAALRATLNVEVESGP